jgi:hypothetical protein
MLCKRVIVFAALVALMSVSQGVAATNLLTDQASFDAAVTGETSGAFTGYTPDGTWLEMNPTLTVGPLTLSCNPLLKPGTSNPDNVTAYNNAAWFQNTGDEGVLARANALAGAISGSYTAFGVTLQSMVNGSSFIGSFALSDGTTVPYRTDAALNSYKGASVFIGIVSTDPAIKITGWNQDITAGGVTEMGGLANFSIGHSAVPEPSAIALLAAGACGLLCYAWRKRK